MDRIWQWAWDRFGTRYSWATLGDLVRCGAPGLPDCDCALVAVERSDYYVEAAVVTVVAILVGAYVVYLPEWAGSVLQSSGQRVTRLTG